MNLFQYLQHWLGRGPCLQVATSSRIASIRNDDVSWAAWWRLWTAHLPGASETHDPWTAAIATRVVLALELLKQELGCRDNL